MAERTPNKIGSSHDKSQNIAGQCEALKVGDIPLLRVPLPPRDNIYDIVTNLPTQPGVTKAN